MLHRKYLEVEETEAAAKAKYGEEADAGARHPHRAAGDRAARGRHRRPDADQQHQGLWQAHRRETVSRARSRPAATPNGSRSTIPRSRRGGRSSARSTARRALKDAEGNTIFEQVPIYVHGDFEGPLRAVLTRASPARSTARMMALKGKTMSLIMNSPMIHNAVEWGRALPAMPGKVATFKVYFEGNRAKNDVAAHARGDRQRAGADRPPVLQSGHHRHDGAPDLTPGRSWTAQGARCGARAVRRGGRRPRSSARSIRPATSGTTRCCGIASPTCRWASTSNFRADMIAKGIDQQTASRIAAHWANRYAGALPKEAMSDAATKVANMLLFSRSFTLGNLGVLKDMLTGLPKDVLAQIERDARVQGGRDRTRRRSRQGRRPRSAQSRMARRKAMAVVGSTWRCCTSATRCCRTP
jgi:hypothetical protein